MSTNIIDVSVDYSKSKNLPIILVASRRQIESKEMGSGYVNNWSTEEFVNYVRSKNCNKVYIERDHGGPCQGNYEILNNLNVQESIAAAKRSFEVDIDSGIQIIHIDPTIPIGNEELTFDKILFRLFELYAHVMEYAAKKNKKIEIELGTEEQSGGYTDIKSFEEFLEKTNQFCIKNKFRHPLFVVIQTGAKVLESKNIGAFESENESEKNKLINNIRESADIAAKYQVCIKEHNADYLSYNNLLMRPNLGIRAANVAPELGFLETKGFLHLLEKYGDKADYDKFIQTVYESEKWRKWLLPQSEMSTLDRVLLAGHYCYSDPIIIDIKKRLEIDLLKKSIHLDECLKKIIQEAFDKYATAFGLLE